MSVRGNRAADGELVGAGLFLVESPSGLAVGKGLALQTIWRSSAMVDGLTMSLTCVGFSSE